MHPTLQPPPTGRSCRLCFFFDGVTAQGTAALCKHEGCARVRSQPQNGCSCWEFRPGAKLRPGDKPPPAR